MLIHPSYFLHRHSRNTHFLSPALPLFSCRSRTCITFLPPLDLDPGVGAGDSEIEDIIFLGIGVSIPADVFARDLEALVTLLCTLIFTPHMPRVDFVEAHNATLLHVWRGMLIRLGGLALLVFASTFCFSACTVMFVVRRTIVPLKTTEIDPKTAESNL